MANFVAVYDGWISKPLRLSKCKLYYNVPVTHNKMHIIKTWSLNLVNDLVAGEIIDIQHEMVYLNTDFPTRQSTVEVLASTASFVRVM